MKADTGKLRLGMSASANITLKSDPSLATGRLDDAASIARACVQWQALCMPRIERAAGAYLGFNQQTVKAPT